MSNNKPCENSSLPNWSKVWSLSLIGVFLIRIFPFINGNYLYDEAMSLTVYVLAKENILQVFRDYSMANNHILSNVIYWLWLSIIGQNGLVLGLFGRFPSIACGIGSILMVLFLWKSFMSERRCAIAALLIALSPVYSGFAWQIRGYSLVFCLGIALVSASLYRLWQMTVRNWISTFLLSLLLPIAMPSAVMLPVAVGMGMGASYWIAKRDIKKAFGLVLPVFIGVFLGGAYYLTLGTQFWDAARAAGGWNSFWLTLGNISLAFALHCGIYTVCIPVLLWQAWRRIVYFIRLKTKVPFDDVLRIYPSLLAFSVAAVILGLLLCRNPLYKYPFPRVFILMLAPLTFAVLSCDVVSRKLSFWKQVALTLCFAVLSNVCCDLYVKWAGSDYSRPCQNLLVQRWRGSEIFYKVARIIIAERQETEDAITLIDGNLVPSVGLYCKLLNFDWLASGFKAVMDAEWLNHDYLEMALESKVKIKILTQNENEAYDILRKISFEHKTSLSTRKQYGNYTYYEVNFLSSP